MKNNIEKTHSVVCESCGKTFETSLYNKRFCSDSCRDRGGRRRAAMQRKRRAAYAAKDHTAQNAAKRAKRAAMTPEERDAYLAARRAKAHTPAARLKARLYKRSAAYRKWDRQYKRRLQQEKPEEIRAARVRRYHKNREHILFLKKCSRVFGTSSCVKCGKTFVNTGDNAVFCPRCLRGKTVRQTCPDCGADFVAPLTRHNDNTVFAEDYVVCPDCIAKRRARHETAPVVAGIRGHVCGTSYGSEFATLEEELLHEINKDQAAMMDAEKRASFEQAMGITAAEKAYNKP